MNSGDIAWDGRCAFNVTASIVMSNDYTMKAFFLGIQAIAKANPKRLP